MVFISTSVATSVAASVFSFNHVIKLNVCLLLTPSGLIETTQCDRFIVSDYRIHRYKCLSSTPEKKKVVAAWRNNTFN